MGAEFDHFTNDDRFALAKHFGFSPYKSTSDHADAYIKAHYRKEDQERNYGDDRDWIRLKDIATTITTGIFIERFVEECFRSQTANQIHQGKRVLNHFYKWREKSTDDYYSLNTEASLTAAQIISEITIHDVYDYVEGKAEVFSEKAYYTPQNSEDRDFNVEKACEWNAYRRTINIASNIDHKMLR